jgi:hypothetical protein
MLGGCICAVAVLLGDPDIALAADAPACIAGCGILPAPAADCPGIGIPLTAVELSMSGIGI